MKNIKNNQDGIKNEVWFLLSKVLNFINDQESDKVVNYLFIESFIEKLTERISHSIHQDKKFYDIEKSLYSIDIRQYYVLLIRQILKNLQNRDSIGDIGPAIDQWLDEYQAEIIESRMKEDYSNICSELNINSSADNTTIVISKLKTLLKESLEDILYFNRRLSHQVLSTLFIELEYYQCYKDDMDLEITKQKINELELRLDSMNAKKIFFELAKEFCPNDIPGVVAEIQKQENFEQALAKYRSDAEKIRVVQEKTLTKLQHGQLMIKNKLKKEKSQDAISLIGSTSSISSFSEQVASTDLAHFIGALVTNKGDYVLEGSQNIYDEAIKNLRGLVENLTLDSVNAALISQKTDSLKEVKQRDLDVFKNNVKENGLQATLLNAKKTELEVLSVLLDQDQNINNNQRNLLGTLIDHNIALKIAGEIDNEVALKKAKMTAKPCSLEAISVQPLLKSSEQQAINAC